MQTVLVWFAQVLRCLFLSISGMLIQQSFVCVAQSNEKCKHHQLVSPETVSWIIYRHCCDLFSLDLLTRKQIILMKTVDRVSAWHWVWRLFLGGKKDVTGDFFLLLWVVTVISDTDVSQPEQIKWILCIWLETAGGKAEDILCLCFLYSFI